MKQQFMSGEQMELPWQCVVFLFKLIMCTFAFYEHMNEHMQIMCIFIYLFCQSSCSLLQLSIDGHHTDGRDVGYAKSDAYVHGTIVQVQTPA